MSLTEKPKEFIFSVGEYVTTSEIKTKLMEAI
jgi:hypothetical protein